MDRVRHFAVVEPGTTSQQSGVVVGHVRRELNVDLAGLGALRPKGLRPLEIDLILVAAAAAFADRRAGRRRRWTRHIHLTVPVSDPGLWRSRPAVTALTGCLGWLTGDAWEFEFVQRSNAFLFDETPNLVPDVTSSAAALAFSGGADSYAAARLMAREASPPLLVCVQAQRRPSLSRLIKHLVEEDGCRAVVVAVNLGNPRNAEATYRTRTFLYFTVAAVAAHVANAPVAAVGENGIGSLGPSLIPSYGEHPHRGTHPELTSRLHHLVRLVLGEGPRFIHPHVAVTKGQLLRRLQEAVGLGLLPETRSCARDGRRLGGHQHCGTCGNCLLRRVAEHAAGLRPTVGYLWEDLDVETLGAAAGPDITSRNDEDIAIQAVLDHHHLAEAPTRVAEPEMRRWSSEAAAGLGWSDEVAASRLSALLSQHDMEWRSFLKERRPGSWVRTLVEEPS